MTRDGNLFFTISYRIWARFAAYFQMIIFSGSFVLLGIFAVVAFFCTSLWIQVLQTYGNQASNENDLCSSRLTTMAVMTIILWFCFVAIAGAILVQFRAASKLFDATESEVGIAKGRKDIRYWWKVNLVFMAIDLLILVTCYNAYIYAVTACVIRVVSLCLVGGYKGQLKKENSKRNCFQSIYSPE